MKLTKALGVAFLMAWVGAAGSVALAGPIASEVGPDLVSNGGFEKTIELAGSDWATSGLFTIEGFDYFIDPEPGNAHGGEHSFGAGAIGGLGFLSQDLATIPGRHYNIHLWIANLGGFADNTELQVLWGGNPVYTATDILGFDYSEIVIDPIATALTTTLTIGLRDDSSYLNVDDISVRALAVPEPATLALLLVGLGVTGMTRRRRSRR